MSAFPENDISKIVSQESKSDEYEILCNPQELIALQKEHEQLKEQLTLQQKLVEEKEAINIEQEKKVKTLTEENSSLNDKLSQVTEQLKKSEEEVVAQLKKNSDDKQIHELEKLEIQAKAKEAQLLTLSQEINKLKESNTKLENELKDSQKESSQNSIKAHHYEEELKKLKSLIDNSNQQIQEQNKLNQSLIRKNNDFNNLQKQREEELKKKDDNKIMFSRIESVNSIFQQVETLKDELLTYEELFRNLDFPTFWDILTSKINEKVDKHAGNKTEFRITQLKHSTEQICQGLQQALDLHKIKFKYEM